MKKFIAESYDSAAVMKEHNITLDDIDHVREIVKRYEQVPKSIINKAILLPLVTCSNNHERCGKLIRNYCKLKKETPEFFRNRDLQSQEVQKCLKNQVYLSLPPTTNNCNLILHGLINCDPKTYVFDDVEKTFMMTVVKYFKLLTAKSSFQLLNSINRTLHIPQWAKERHNFSFRHERISCWSRMATEHQLDEKVDPSR